MSLKSSEIHNYSSSISTVLISFLVSSSCDAFLPLAVRPMRTIREIFLKILCNSSELNSTIIFSMLMLSMTKKMHQFLRYFKICKSGKRRKTGAKYAVHKDENCFLSDPTCAQDVCVQRKMLLSCLLSQAVM